MDMRWLEPWLFRIPVGAASRLRVTLFRLLGMRIGSGNRFEAIRVRRCSQIEFGNQNTLARGCVLFPRDGEHDGKRIVIGSGCGLNRNVFLDANGLITIGDDVSIGPDVYMTDSNHSLTTSANRRTSPLSVGRITIGNRCWIGAKAIILKDVELGDYCVVAAGAVVTKSFPPRSVVAGVPARLIKTLPGETTGE